MNQDQTPVLVCKDLCISYYTRAGEIPAVVDFSLTVLPGETIGIVGESGCGKSTVAMAIMQYMGANGGIKSGSITFKGRDLTQLSEDQLRRIRGSEIAMIYQEPFASLNPSLKIKTQLMEVPLAHENISKDEARRRAVEMLSDVKLPDPERLMESYPHQLSGGQQQRVVIAMGLLSNPSLLLLDEPTTALDVTVEAGIVKLVADISKKYGTSQIYISHNLGLILETCDRVFVMYSGEVVEEGTIDSLFTWPRHPYTHGLFACIPLPTADKHAAPLKPIRGQLPLPFERPRGCYYHPRCDHFKPGLCDREHIKMEHVEDSAADHRVRCLRYKEIDHHLLKPSDEVKEPIALGKRVLNVDGMKKYYEVRDSSLRALFSGKRIRYVKANEELNFTAQEGETVAIVGESGCGKSTFAKVLMGLESGTDGEVRHKGKDISEVAVRDRSDKQISSLQMVFQNPFDTLNPSHGVGGQLSRVIKKFGGETDKKKIFERVMTLLDTVKLPRDFYYRKPRQLSGGQKQRVGIARAFAGNPSMVIADEPISALDVSVAAAVTELLTDIQREHKTTLLFISHDLSVVRYLADRIVVMYLGHILERGTTEQVFDPPYHPYTEALLSAVPIADPEVTKREIVLEGNLPSAMNPPKGCPFCTRCHRRIGEICDIEMPPDREVVDRHVIKCHIPIEELSKIGPVIIVPDESERIHATKSE
ncbi:Oligopeptide/dipeptide ABC transporter, ATP-binding protein [Olavius algarvensis associated proteobacterium Delta 3]|nr:Oligopeptide/dipeptide ABC transporter, ATP-binding protein [Olavius algarvensis associated proteobacterium Delta 3]CAB5128444.1 Oligopeptide/dipeptide ABC transporter, ATP-binding protein [Olavius algarvensis associated proteobacterium Delta 3]